MMNSKLGRFRAIALIEAISYLILLFIAMPLKYMADMPAMVKYTGWLHGLLFVIYGILLLQVWISYKWSFWKTTLVFISSLIPFAPFFVDRKLKQEDRP
jgi:integral membrane protein